MAHVRAWRGDDGRAASCLRPRALLALVLANWTPRAPNGGALGTACSSTAGDCCPHGIAPGQRQSGSRPSLLESVSRPAFANPLACDVSVIVYGGPNAEGSVAEGEESAKSSGACRVQRSVWEWPLLALAFNANGREQRGLRSEAGEPL